MARAAGVVLDELALALGVAQARVRGAGDLRVADHRHGAELRGAEDLFHDQPPSCAQRRGKGLTGVL